MDCLKAGRRGHPRPPRRHSAGCTSRYAIEKGINTFMEKPITVDGPTTRRMLALGEEAKKKNLKVGVGLMCRHCDARAGALQPDQGRRDRRYRHAPGVPPDGTGRLGLDAAQARRHQRADVSDPEVPRLPLGQRRLFQRLLDPQHRRMLLDEGRLAGHRPRDGGPLLSRRLHRPELRHLLRRVHLRRRHQALPRRPEHRRLPPGIRQLRPRHQGHRRSSPRTRTARPGAASTRARK